MKHWKELSFVLLVGLVSLLASCSGVNKDKLTLSIYQIDPFTVTGVQADKVAKKIEADTGVTMDILNHDDQKWPVMLASGDLPDLILMDGRNMKELIEGDHILALDDMVKQYGTNITKNVSQSTLDYARKYYSNGTGKLYTLLTTGGPWPKRYKYQDVSLSVRWDYYKELGYPEFNSYDDLLKVLKDMQDKHPKNEQGQKAYSLSVWSDWGLWPYNVWFAYSRGRIVVGPGTVMEMDYSDGKFKNAIMEDDSGIWDGLTFFNKASRLGILDPESLTQKYQNVVEKHNAYRVYANLASWPYGGANKQMVAEGTPNKGLMPLPPLKGANRFQYNSIFNSNGTYTWVIPKKSKDPVRAMQLIDYFYNYDNARYILSGIQGEDWSVENGKPKLTADHVQKYIADANFQEQQGYWKYHKMLGFSWGTISPADGVVLDLHSSSDIWSQQLTELDKDFNAKYGVEYPGQYVENMVKNGEVRIGDYPAIPAAIDVDPAEKEEISRIDAQIAEAVTRASAKIVLAKSEVEFNTEKLKLREELKKLNIDKSYEFWNKYYTAGFAVVKDAMK